MLSKYSSKIHKTFIFETFKKNVNSLRLTPYLKYLKTNLLKHIIYYHTISYNES